LCFFEKNSGFFPTLSCGCVVFQYVSEKIGGAKGTELEDDIVDMEKVRLLHCVRK